MSTYILDFDPMSYRMYLKLSMWPQNCLKLAPVCSPRALHGVCVWGWGGVGGWGGEWWSGGAPLNLPPEER